MIHSIRPATQSDVKYVMALQRANRERRGRLLNVWRQSFGPSLLELETFQVTPVAQERIDTFDQQTGFFTHTPDGFADAGKLQKLAWANRKKANPK